MTELRRAVQLDPDGPDGLFELGQAVAPGAESLRLLEHAVRERASFTEAWLALGSQLLAAGRTADAKKAAIAAVHEDPSGVAPKILVGKVALAEGRADDAVRAGEAALKIMANSAPAKLLVADGNASKGEIDLALEAYQAAWGLDHGDPTPLVHAAEACHAAGRDTSAQGLRAQGRAGVPEVGPRVGGARGRPRRPGREGGGKGRVPEGAGGGGPRGAGRRAEEAERAPMSMTERGSSHRA